MELETHLLPSRIKDWGSSTAYWSIEPAQDALVFVHGFGGHATDTWKYFPEMLVGLKHCRYADIFFFGYNSRHVRATLSAVKLLAFLQKVCQDVKCLMSNSLGYIPESRVGTEYKRVLVVSHSLGGVLCRQMVIQGQPINEDWVRNLELILFAPAHKGADTIELIRSALSFPIGRALAAILEHRYAVLRDIGRGSPFLKKLEDDTEELIALHSEMGNTPQDTSLIARRVIFGELENIVTPDVFARDPEPMVYENMNHTDICKPNGKFTGPYREVVGVL